MGLQYSIVIFRYSGLACLSIESHQDSTPSLRYKSLRQISLYLVHSFPKIRVYAAEQFYMTLLSLEKEFSFESFINESIKTIENLLLITNW